MDFINAHWKEIAEIVLGIIGVSWVIKISVRKNSSDNNVTQKNNVVKGDQAGRDINKK